MAAVPVVNGVSYSWNTATLILFGIPVIGITKINFKRSQEKTNNQGWGADPISRGYGNNKYEGSIELYLDEWKRIIAASPGRNPLLIPPFDIIVVHGGLLVRPEKDVLKFCEFLEDPLTVGQGDTSIKCEIPLIIGRIDR